MWEGVGKVLTRENSFTKTKYFRPVQSLLGRCADSQSNGEIHHISVSWSVIRNLKCFVIVFTVTLNLVKQGRQKQGR